MSANFLKKPPKYHSKGNKRFIGIIVVLVVAAIAILAAALVLPAAIDHYNSTNPNSGRGQVYVQSIVPLSDFIAVGADMSNVRMRVEYSDRTYRIVALSELNPIGLNTHEAGQVDNVVLTFGNFTQTISFTVTSTLIEIQYIVDFGGRIEGNRHQSIVAGHNGTTVEAVASEGYEFDGWSDGFTLAERRETAVTMPMTIFARFRLKEYIVIFQFPDGTTGREAPVLHGNPATNIPSPNEQQMRRHGHVFIGWDVSHNDLMRVTRNMVVRPRYQRVAADSIIDITRGIDGLPLATFLNPNPGGIYTWGVTDAVTISTNPGMSFERWEVKNAKGDWVIVMPSTVGMNIAINNDNNLVPFSATPDLNRPGQYSILFTPTTNTTLLEIRAVLVYDESPITFRSMNNLVGSPVIVERGQPLGEVFGAPVNSGVFNAFTPDALHGYTFVGWFLNGGELNPDGTQRLVRNDTVFVRPSELVAVWQRLQFNVTFMAGYENIDGYEDSMSDNMPPSGITYRLYFQATLDRFPTTPPTKRHHTFVGWFVFRNGVPTNEAVDLNFSITDNTWLYPRFAVDTKNLNVVIGRGSGSASVFEIGNPAPATPLIGTFTMQIIKPYAVNLVAANGWLIEEFTITITRADGTQETRRQVGGGNTSLVVNIERDPHNHVVVGHWRIDVLFAMRENVVTVANGTSATFGTVEFTHIVDGVVIREEENKPDFWFSVEYGGARQLRATARFGYYISSIFIGGDAVLNIPARAGSFTLVVENINAALFIEINYGEIIFEAIAIPPVANQGSLTEVLTGPYTVARPPVFNIAAAQGYFVRNVFINNIQLNLFADLANADNPLFALDDVEILNVAVAAALLPTLLDDRLTSFEITITNFYQSFEISVEFAPLLLNVEIRTEGYGYAAQSFFNVEFNGEVLASVFTAGDHFIESYVVRFALSGIEQLPSVLDFVTSEYIINEKGITADLIITVYFRQRIFTVTLGPDSNRGERAFATVEANKSGSALSIQTGTTFNVLATSTHSYVIVANPTYRIENIIIRADNSPQRFENIGWNVREHEIRLDRIRDNFVIVVECVKIEHRVNLVAADAVGLLHGTPASFVQDGGIYSVDFRYDPNVRRINVNQIIIRSLVTGALVTNSIQIDLSQGGSFGGNLVEFRLTFESIAEDVEILVPVGYTQVTGGNPVEITLAASVGGTLLARRSHDGQEFSASAAGNTKFDLPVGANPLGEIMLFADANAGFSFRHLVINGERVTQQLHQNITQNLFIYAVFEQNAHRLTVAPTAGGMVTSNKTTFVGGDTTLEIYVAPARGFELSILSFTVNGQVHNMAHSVVQQINSGDIRFVVPSNLTTADITVNTTFSPTPFNVTLQVAAEGAEGLASVGGTVGGRQLMNGQQQIAFFDEIYLIDIVAADGYFIDSIVVNGLEVEPSQMASFLIGDALRYVSGPLRGTVLGNVNIVVSFAPNMYRITLVRAHGGTTRVVAGDEPESDGANLMLPAGADLSVIMRANLGFHIAKLIINHQEVDPVLWQISPTANNNLNLSYAISNLNSNLVIQVVYEINLYSVTYTIANTSLNFAAYDTDPKDYGEFSILSNGRLLLSHTPFLYEDIRHGNNLIFLFAPVVARGYFVSLFTVEWTDLNGSGVAEVFNYTDVAARDGHVTFLDLSGNLTIVVEFRRETFYFQAQSFEENLGSPFAPSTTLAPLNISFFNPIDRSAAPHLIEQGDGFIIEFGLQYTIVFNPPAGFFLQDVLVNGGSRILSVALNTLSGEVRVQTIIEATYEIFRYLVTLDVLGRGVTNVFSGGVLLFPYPAVASLPTPTGVAWFEQGGMWVTHGTALSVNLTPEFNDGFTVTTFRMTSRTSVTDFRPTINPDDFSTTPFLMTSEADFVIRYGLHRYAVVTSFSENYAGNLSLVINPDNRPPDSSVNEVFWGGGATVTITLNQGYSLHNVLINDIEVADGLTQAQNTGVFRLNDIRANLSVVFVVVRQSFDIEYIGSHFNGSFAKRTFGEIVDASQNAVAGVSLLPFGSPTTINLFSASPAGQPQHALTAGATRFSGNVILGGGGSGSAYQGARFNDWLNFVFIPVNGYEISKLVIAVYDINNSNNLGANDLLWVPTYEFSTDEGDLISSIYRGGFYSFELANLRGLVRVQVEYRLKQYDLRIFTPGVAGAGTLHSVTSNGVNIDLGETDNRVLNHHAHLVFHISARHGFNLQNAVVSLNGIIIPAIYTINPDASGNYYTYATVAIYVDNALLLGITNNLIDIILFFVANEYLVSRSVETDGRAQGFPPEDTLTTFVDGDRIVFSLAATGSGRVVQTRPEGFRIVSIIISNAAVVPLGHPLTGFHGGVFALNVTASFANSDVLTLSFTSATLPIVNMLDAHHPEHRTLYIFYVTDMYMYNSSVGAYMHMGGNRHANYVNNSIFLLNRTFTTEIDGDGRYEHFTEASFSLFLIDVQYEFEGFQEWDAAAGMWRYVANGVNGIRLYDFNADGVATRLEYTLNRDRQFRAVIYRIYRVEFFVFPEFKYVSGSFTNANMRYRLFSSVTVNASYDADNRPNLAGGADNHTLRNENDEANGLYVYFVRSGARLHVVAEDRLSENPTVAPASFFTIVDGLDFSAGGRAPAQNFAVHEQRHTVAGNTTVHIYFQNDIYFSVGVVSEGAAAANQGGSVAFSGTTPALGSNRTNTVGLSNFITLTITPTLNYRFNGIYVRERQAAADSNGFAQLTQNFRPLTSLTDLIAVGAIRITENVDASGRITSVVVQFLPLDNMELRVNFLRQIRVQSFVSLFTEAEGFTMPPHTIVPHLTRPAIDTGDGFNPVIIDFNTPLRYSVERPSATGWNTRFQFVGFHVNGVNRFGALASSLPRANDYTVNFILTDQGSGSVPIITEDGLFVVRVVALFIPVLNITIENEHMHVDADGVIHRFDPGPVTFMAPTFTDERLNYSQITREVRPFMGGSATDRTVQVLSRMNLTSGDRNIPNSPYNTWLPNRMTLAWPGRTSPANQLNYRNYGWEFLDLTDADNPRWRPILGTFGGVANSQFSFNVSDLIKYSYFNVPQGAETVQNGWAFGAAMHGPTGSVDHVNIPTLRIRVALTRFENITVRADIRGGEPTAGSPRPMIWGRPASDWIRFDNARVENDIFVAGDHIRLFNAPADGYTFEGWVWEMPNPDGTFTDVWIERRGNETVLETRQVDPDDPNNPIRTPVQPPAPDAFEIMSNALGSLFIRVLGTWVLRAVFTRAFAVQLAVQNGSLALDSPYAVAHTPEIIFIGESRTGAAGSYQIVNDINHVHDLPINSGHFIQFKLRQPNVATPSPTCLATPQCIGACRCEILQATPEDNFFRTQGRHFAPFNAQGEPQNLPRTRDGHPFPLVHQDGVDLASTGRSFIGDAGGGTMHWDVVYTLFVDRDVTIVFQFDSFATLVVENVYPGAQLRLPQSLINQLNADRGNFGARNYIRDRMSATENDHVDNLGIPFDRSAVAGTIRISQIRIQPTENFYRGAFTSVLTPLAGQTRLDTVFGTDDGTTDHLNFHGRNTTAERNLRTISFFHPAGQTTGGVSREPFPFARNTNAANGPTGFGNGTPAHPFYIENEVQLGNINRVYEQSVSRTLRNIHFRLIANITLTNVENSGNTVLGQGIGHDAAGRGFDGVFQGGNGAATFAIYNFIHNRAVNNVGIFSRLGPGGRIENLQIGSNLTGRTVNGNINVGLLVGQARGDAGAGNRVAIHNVRYHSSQATHLTGRENIGGIVGYAEYADITDVFSDDVRITASFANAGGLVGHLAGGAFLGSSQSSRALAQATPAGFYLTNINGATAPNATTSNSVARNPYIYAGPIIGGTSSGAISTFVSDGGRRRGGGAGGAVGRVSNTRWDHAASRSTTSFVSSSPQTDVAIDGVWVDFTGSRNINGPHAGGVVGFNGIDVGTSAANSVTASANSGRVIQHMRVVGQSYNVSSIFNNELPNAHAVGNTVAGAGDVNWHANWDKYGTGGIVGFNGHQGVIRHAALGVGSFSGSSHTVGPTANGTNSNAGTGTAVVMFRGAFVGGIVGVNVGTAEYTNTGNHRFYALRDINHGSAIQNGAGNTLMGGVYGTHVGFNSGNLRFAHTVSARGLGTPANNATVTKTQATDNYTFLVLSRLSVDSWTPFLVFPNSDGNAPFSSFNTIAQDTTRVYFGGVAGINTINNTVSGANSGNTVQNSSFMGRISFSRGFNNGNHNTTSMGGIVGAGGTTNCTINNANVWLHYFVWCDTISSTDADAPIPATATVRFGHFSGTTAAGAAGNSAVGTSNFVERYTAQGVVRRGYETNWIGATVSHGRGYGRSDIRRTTHFADGLPWVGTHNHGSNSANTPVVLRTLNNVLGGTNTINTTVMRSSRWRFFNSRTGDPPDARRPSVNLNCFGQALGGWSTSGSLWSGATHYNGRFRETRFI
jgi:hypothetical protein